VTHTADELGYHGQVMVAERRTITTLLEAVPHVVTLILSSGIDIARGTIGFLGLTLEES